VRFLLLIPLFLIWDAQSPAAAAWLHIPRHLGLPTFFFGYCLLILLTRIWGRRLSYGVIKGDTGRAVDRFNIGMAIARGLIPVWFAVGVYCLGWGNPILGPIARWPVATPAMLLGLMPGLLAWTGLWWGQFPVDRAMREQNLLYQLEADLPVVAPPDFRGYFTHKLRGQLLFVLVPWTAIKVLLDLSGLVMQGISHTAIGGHWLSHAPVKEFSDSAVSFACVLVVLMISPELLRHVLDTQKIPESPLRESLSDICRRSGVSCREILIWHTQNNLGNAAVMGLVPWVRYVMLSDLLLKSMTTEQIQAVFAHELGHVKHRHLVWFVVFLLTFSLAISALLVMLESHLTLTTSQQQAYDITSNVGCGLVLLLAYGFLSRWFERQADVYAARTVQLAALPVAVGADLTTDAAIEYSGEHSGASIFASALHRVALVNNIPINARNWTHGSIASRMRYIRQFGRDPQIAERFDRTTRRVLWGLSVLIIICTAIAVYGGLRG